MDLSSPIQIERRIYMVRGHRVMLDVDLAELYGVKTFNLNKAVKRNKDRFPEDFVFQLTSEETSRLIFQFGISKTRGRGGSRYSPYAFTEQGVAMLSGVLRSKRAVQVNVAIRGLMAPPEKPRPQIGFRPTNRTSVRIRRKSGNMC